MNLWSTQCEHHIAILSQLPPSVAAAGGRRSTSSAGRKLLRGGEPGGRQSGAITACGCCRVSTTVVLSDRNLSLRTTVIACKYGRTRAHYFRC